MIDTNQILPHMEVIDNAGNHVGVVDHLDGEDRIKLAKNDPASGGQHHWIAVDTIASVDGKIQLNCPASQAYVS